MIVDRLGKKTVVVCNKNIDEVIKIDGVEDLSILIDMEDDEDRIKELSSKMDMVIKNHYNVDEVIYNWYM